MTEPAGSRVERASRALKAGEWSTARDLFEAVLDEAETGDAAFGLGVAVWWLGDTEDALRAWARAYVAYRRQRESELAVITAVYLSLAYRMSLGNDAASAGWLERAATLVDDLGLRGVEGWVQLCHAYAATDNGHPQDGERWARQARENAREYGDTDLELCCAAELGAALVAAGRIDDGTGVLDEAMARTLAGEAEDLDAVVLVSCRTITSCSRAGDAKRATQWVHAADDFHRRYGSPHLFTTCRTHYGAVLVSSGRWREAEDELAAALRVGRAAEPALRGEAVAKLAELRLAQGRLEEAASLLEGREGEAPAAYPTAALHTARGDFGAAAAVLRRRLRHIEADCLEALCLHDLFVEVEIASGDIGAADERAGLLAEVADARRSPAVVARSQRATGRVLLAKGAVSEAAEHFESALAAFERVGMPLEVGRTRMLMAEAVRAADPAAAVVEARAALHTFEVLGAAHAADGAAAVLAALGVRVSRSRPPGEVLSGREREVLALLGEGLSNPEIAARLFIARKTVEHHVANVLAKLGLRSRGEATAYAVRHEAEDSGAK